MIEITGTNRNPNTFPKTNVTLCDKCRTLPQTVIYGSGYSRAMFLCDTCDAAIPAECKTVGELMVWIGYKPFDD